MPGHDIIAIGASAGGVEALIEVVRALPPDLPAAVFVVLHIPPGGQSALPKILTAAGHLPATHPKDGDPIEYGHIYVAPPDQHLLVERDRIRVTRGPRENRSRPAVDPLFRSAASAYGPRVIGVVLSGMLDDGSIGMIAIAARRHRCRAGPARGALPRYAAERDQVRKARSYRPRRGDWSAP